MTASNAERQDTVDKEKEEFIERLRRILGSCSINFLFGAGVNGGCFPQFNSFEDTLSKLKEYEQPGTNMEQEVSCLSANERDEVLEVFCEEFSSCFNKMDWGNASLSNIGHLLQTTNAIVAKAENRHPESKRINIFTLNYDRIVETVLETKGLFAYTLNVKESKSNIPFEIVGYNVVKREYVPTFAVYKMHGSATASGELAKDDIVFPGADKLGSVISDFYESLFAMKGELLRKNSVLFVIGYSWSDAHINGIISDAIGNGLNVYQLQFDKTDPVPPSIRPQIEVVLPNVNNPRQDTTLTLTSLFREVIR